MKLKLLIVLTLVFSLNGKAQNTVSIAFQNSYTYEYNQEYDRAVQSMISVYSDKSYDINLRLGWLNYLKGDYTKSVSYYKMATRLIPKSIEARIGLVYPLQVLQKWDEVIKVYEQILSIDPYHSKTNYQLAYIYYVRKDYRKSYNYAKRVFDVLPFDYDTNLLLGKLSISLGNISEAQKHLNKALNSSPTSIEVINILKSIN